MVSAVVASPDTTKSMPAIPFGTGFGDHAVLDRYIFTMVNRQNLIAAPTGRHMVQDNVFLVPATDCISFNLGICSYADIPDNHVIGTDAKTSSDANAISWCSLSGDGDSVILDIELTFNGA